jgi:hypothetical protein
MTNATSSNGGRGACRDRFGALRVLALSILLFASPGLRAGSVFMKNGYIIHGPVMERSDEEVVLAWDNGKVRIHRRFIESLVFDPGEEQRLKELEALRAEELRAVSEPLMDPGLGREIEELPTDLEVLLKQHAPHLLAHTATDPGVEAIAGVGPGETPGTHAGQIPPPRDPATALPSAEGLGLLAERAFGLEQRFSLMPPRGWNVKVGEVFQVIGPGGTDGGRASLSVVSLPRRELSWQECLELFREEQARVIEGFEVLAEGARRLTGAEDGHEVIGRGSFEGKELVLRQILVPHGARFWMVSGFSAGGPGDEGFSLIEESLKTLEFLHD